MGGERDPFVVAFVAVCSLFAGCSVSLGAVASRVPTDPRSTHLGGDLEAHIHLPRRYEWIVGASTSHLGQLSPETPADQGRAAVVLGYSDVPSPTGSCVGFESTLRIGGFRGSSGPLVPGGPYAGLSLGLPIRMSASDHAWEHHSFFYDSLLLVPSFTFNALVPQFHFHDTQPELMVGLAARFTLWSTLVP
jgi:hypothetical protein